MPFAFGPDRRLRRHAEFVREQRNARRISAGAFTLLVAAQGGSADGPSRLGLVITRKVGNAVQRNRVKRVCRECFRLFPGILPAGVDLIVVAHAGADRLALADVQTQWFAVQGPLRKRAAEALARRATPDHPPATGSNRT